MSDEPTELDVDALERALDEIELDGCMKGEWDRLTYMDNGRLARVIAAEYERQKLLR